MKSISYSLVVLAGAVVHSAATFNRNELSIYAGLAWMIIGTVLLVLDYKRPG